MNEDFVSRNIAVKLMGKGFSLEKSNLQDGSILLYNLLHVEKISSQNEAYRLPTISQVLKWLREEKNIHIEIVSSAYGYIYIVSDTPNKGGTDRVNSRYRGSNDGGAWDDYNECVLDAIECVIDNLY